MDYIKSLEDAGDRLIDGIRSVQDSTVAAVEQIGKTVRGIVPDVSLPLPVELPRPRQVAESTFRFLERLAENQKEFTLKLIDAIDPVSRRAKKSA